MLMSSGVTFVDQGLCSGRVCLSVCLSHHLATALGLLLWARWQEISTDCCAAGARQKLLAVSRCQPTYEAERSWSLIYKISYDNAKVSIGLQRTSNLQNILRRAQGFS